MRRFARRAALLLAACASLLAPSPGSAPDAAAPHPRPPAEASVPVLAVEDTLKPDIKATYMEVLVTAKRETLDEILRRVAEGEARRDSLIEDQVFTLFTRLSGRDRPEAPPSENEPLAESVVRVYQERPGKARTAVLRQWSREEEEEEKEKQKGTVSIQIGSEGAPEDSAKSGVRVIMDSDMSQQFVAFAFDPAARSRFRFHIEERNIVGNQVIYRIAFVPKSPIEPLPTGRVWVNTNDFVILREELSYGDRSPAPLFVESVDSFVLERTRVDGRYWTISRILARVTLTGPTRLMARVGGMKIPKVIEFAARWDDWAINRGIADSLFAPAEDGVR